MLIITQCAVQFYRPKVGPFINKLHMGVDEQNKIVFSPSKYLFKYNPLWPKLVCISFFTLNIGGYKCI